MPNVTNLKADPDNGKDAISGIYRARVESNLDPLHLGRVKVRIPQFHGIPSNQNPTALSNEALPWAFPITMTGAGFNHGSCVVPETGDYVFVMFENGDRNSPVYLGGCYGIPTNAKDYGNKGDNPSAQSMWGGKGWSSAPGMNEMPAEVYPVGDSPNGKVIYKSPKGFVIMVNETDLSECLIICDNDNQQIRISNPSDDSYSEISIEGKGGQSIHVLSSGESAEVTILSADQATSVQVKDGTAKVTSPSIELVGKVSIEGDVNVTGNINASGDILATGNNSNHHTH